MSKSNRLTSLLALATALALGGCDGDISFLKYQESNSAGLAANDMSRALAPAIRQLTQGNLAAAHAALPEHAAPALDRAAFERRARQLGLDSLTALRWTGMTHALDLAGWKGELHGTAWRRNASALALTARLRRIGDNWSLVALDGHPVQAGEAPAEQLASASATAAATAGAAPSDRTALVGSTMSLFIAAVRARNAGELHRSASAMMRRQHSAAALDAAFKPFYDRLRITGDPLAGRQPVISKETARDAHGQRVIVGHYDFPDSRMVFTLGYVEENGQPLLSSISVNVEPKRAATAPATAQPKSRT